MEDVVIKLISDIIKSIGNPTRLKILNFLKEGEKSVIDIINFLGMEQSNVSQHLGVLKNNGLVEFQKVGTKKLYKLKYPEVMDMIKLSNSILSQQLQESGKTLKYVKAI